MQEVRVATSYAGKQHSRSGKRKFGRMLLCYTALSTIKNYET